MTRACPRSPTQLAGPGSGSASPADLARSADPRTGALAGAVVLWYRQNCGIAQHVTIAQATLSRPPDQAATCGPARSGDEARLGVTEPRAALQAGENQAVDPSLHGVRGGLLHDDHPEHR